MVEMADVIAIARGTSASRRRETVRTDSGPPPNRKKIRRATLYLNEVHLNDAESVIRHNGLLVATVHFVADFYPIT